MIKPLADRVLLEKIEAEKKSPGGIILAETSKEKPSMAKVIAIGPGKVEDGQLVPVDVKIGQTVIFKQYSGTEVKFEQKEYLLVDSKDILAIVE